MVVAFRKRHGAIGSSESVRGAASGRDVDAEQMRRSGASSAGPASGRPLRRAIAVSRWQTESRGAMRRRPFDRLRGGARQRSHPYQVNGASGAAAAGGGCRERLARGDPRYVRITDASLLPISGVADLNCSIQQREGTPLSRISGTTARAIDAVDMSVLRTFDCSTTDVIMPAATSGIRITDIRNTWDPEFESSWPCAGSAGIW